MPSQILLTSSPVCHGALRQPAIPFEDTYDTNIKCPKGHIKTGILDTTSSGSPLILGFRSIMQDPYVYAVFWAPKHNRTKGASVMLGCTGAGYSDRVLMPVFEASYAGFLLKNLI